MNKKLAITVVILAVIVGGIAVGLKKGQPVGVVSGPDVYSYLHVHGPFVEGGGKTATSSTASTYTLTDEEIRDTSVLEWTVNVDTTVTLPASTTISRIPNAGDKRSIWIYNASSTAAATLTLAAGTGIDLQKNEDTADLAIAGLDWAELTFIRKANSDIAVIISEYTEAD